MPSVITHKTILMLGAKRLRQLQRALRALDRPTDLEVALGRLVGETLSMLTKGPVIEGERLPEVLRLPESSRSEASDDIGQFAIMGSMGPDLSAFSAVLAAGQGHVFDTVHKGNPDHHREWLNARTADLVLAISRQADARIERRVEAAGAGTASERAAHRERLRAPIRAYLLGHLAHCAGDILTHPYTNDVEWSTPVEGHEKVSHQQTELGLDAKVAQEIWGVAGLHDRSDWGDYWPAEESVHELLFESYAAALEEVYGFASGAPEGRSEGFEHFRTLHDGFAPPAADAAFLRDGYGTYRGVILDMLYEWGYGRWFAFLLILWLPFLALPWLLLALPSGGGVLDGDFDEKTIGEGLSLAIGLGLVPSWLLSIIVTAITSHGVGGALARGFTVLGLSTVATIGFVVYSATVPDDEGDNSTWPALRWALAGASLAAGLVPAIEALRSIATSDPAEHKMRGKDSVLPILFAVPLVFALLFALLWLILFGIGDAASDDDGAGDAGDTAAPFILLAGLWSALGLFLTFWLPTLAADAVPDEPEEFPTARRHHVRLQPDASLYRLGQLGPFYPSGFRPLVELWRARGDDGTLHARVSADHSQLELHEDDEPTSVPPFQATRSLASDAPRTTAQWAAALDGAEVELTDTRTDTLGARAAVSTSEDYPLPSARPFADGGQAHEADEADWDERVERRVAFHALEDGAPDSDDEADFTLHHPPKAHFAERFHTAGRFDGEVTEAQEETWHAEGAENGWLYVHDYASAPQDRLIFHAGDLAALMMLGGASHLVSQTVSQTAASAVQGGSQGQGVRASYEVLRNWSLDRRRVDEWRELVLGDPEVDPADVATPDPLFDAVRLARPAGAAAPLAGEALGEGWATARRRGWTGLLRAYQKAIETADDGAGADADTLRALRRGMAYLFDLPDPRPTGGQP
ncbi:MAG: zinc dependent phospholipase C family protein [Acidobacteriota bacterium]